MPSAKAELDSRAAQLIGFPCKFMVPLTCPTYEIANTAQKREKWTLWSKDEKDEIKTPSTKHARVKTSKLPFGYMRKWK